MPQAILWEIIWQVKKSLLIDFVDKCAFIQVPATNGCGLHKEDRRMGKKKTVEQSTKFIRAWGKEVLNVKIERGVTLNRTNI